MLEHVASIFGNRTHVRDIEGLEYNPPNCVLPMVNGCVVQIQGLRKVYLLRDRMVGVFPFVESFSQPMDSMLFRTKDARGVRNCAKGKIPLMSLSSI